MFRKPITLIFKLLKAVFVLLFFAVLFYFSAALVLSFTKTHPPKPDCSATNEIYITTNGVHLDILLPAENIPPDLLYRLKVGPGTKYVSFGWGDREFYINTPEWKDLTLKTAFKALFLKSETAIHVTCYRSIWPKWKPVQLCNFQIDKLNRFIERSFQKDTDGRLQKIDVPGYFENDAFYAATGSFSLFNTCNVWVNRALKEAGVQTSVWSPFDFGILHHLP